MCSGTKDSGKAQANSKPNAAVRARSGRSRAAAAASDATWLVAVKRMVFDGYTIDFADAAPKPAVALKLRNVEFVGEDLSNAPARRSRIRVMAATADGGRIAIRLALAADGGAVLTVADDGVGGVGPRQSDAPEGGIGLALMAGFARQLGGTVAFETEGGTVIRLTVPNLVEEPAAAAPPPTAA